jgi:hypothetical protein
VSDAGDDDAWDDDLDELADYFEAIEAEVHRLCTPEFLEAKLLEIRLRIRGGRPYCPSRPVRRRRPAPRPSGRGRAVD